MRLLRTSMVTALVLAGAVSAAGDGAAIQLRGVDGRVLTPFKPAQAAHVLFFVATDCPISNSYAPEIQSVCRDYAGRGVSCSLIYEDVEVAGFFKLVLWLAPHVISRPDARELSNWLSSELREVERSNAAGQPK